MKENKLIAEFMGLKRYGYKDENYLVLNKHLSPEQLPYHTSWDWLMPVANEIIKSRDEQNADWDLTDLKYALQTTNIEYVYKAVVEFINEYNKQEFDEEHQSSVMFGVDNNQEL